MVFKTAQMVKFFGLDMKHVYNPNWTTVALFTFISFFSMRIESSLLSVAVPASINGMLGSAISLLAVHP